MPLQLLDDALPHDVVRETAERLRTDDILDTLADQLEHLTRQEPALTGLITQRHIFPRHLRERMDVARRSEACGLRKGLPCGLPEELKQRDRRIAERLALPAGTQILILEILVVEAVEQEVHEIRHDGLRPLALEQLHDMVVRERRELDEDLADDPDLRLLEALLQRQHIEIMDDAAHVP